MNFKIYINKSRYHFLYPDITSFTHVSLPLPGYHFLYPCITSSIRVSLPLPGYHFLYPGITSFTHVSLPLSMYHFLYLGITSFIHVSLPLPGYHFLYPYITSFTRVSLPLSMYCCYLPTSMTLASGGSPMFPLVVHQPPSPSIWPAVQSLRQGLSTNPGVTMWYVCG